jgi:hypothetical protein
VVEDDAAGVEHLGVHQLQGEVPGEVVDIRGPAVRTAGCTTIRYSSTVLACWQ